MNHFHESAAALMKELVAEYQGPSRMREHHRNIERVNLTKLQTYFELMVRAQDLDEINAQEFVETMRLAQRVFQSGMDLPSVDEVSAPKIRPRFSHITSSAAVSVGLIHIRDDSKEGRDPLCGENQVANWMIAENAPHRSMCKSCLRKYRAICEEMTL